MPWPKLVLLDRDGVINADSPNYILTPAAWEALPGSLEAIARLSQIGIQVAICTNQSAVGRGMLEAATLRAIHAKLNAQLTAVGGELSGIFVCPHAPQDQCNCRKPAPGLCQQALAATSHRSDEALFIGDSQRDLEAARAAGITAWLVRSGNGALLERQSNDPSLPVFDDLVDAVNALLKKGSGDA